jgi:Na+-transporting methylmalonyl-CoA/oxaloacetate decarboxylase gamma subunit
LRHGHRHERSPAARAALRDEFDEVEIPLLKILLVSAVTMGLSHTIARERIFAPLRDRCGGMETWRGYLISCPYCASHWVAFLLVPLTGAYGIRVAGQWGVVSMVLDWFLSSILVTVIAAMLRVVFYFVDEEQRLIKTKKRTAQAEAEQAEERLIQ